MKLHYDFNKTPLYIAVEKENVEIIKLLLRHPYLDINAFNAHLSYLFIKYNECYAFFDVSMIIIICIYFRCINMFIFY